MVFDGEHLTPFDEELLADLQRARSAPALAPVVVGPTSRGHRRPGARVVALAMTVFVGLVVAVALVATRATGGQGGVAQGSGVNPSASTGAGFPLDVGGPVVAALARTAGAGAFHIDYQLAWNPPASPTRDDCAAYRFEGSDQWEYFAADPRSNEKLRSLNGQQGEFRIDTRPVPAICDASDPGAGTLGGQATVDVGAQQMIVIAGSGTVSVSLRLAGDTVWMSGGQDYANGLGPGNGPGQALSSAGRGLESALGRRTTALSMARLASPNGYLDLDQSAITGATPTGTADVDGVPVTTYAVQEDLSRLLSTPGLSAVRHQTIQDALDQLGAQHYTGSEATVAVDGAGFIRRITSVAHFADGGTATSTGTYSGFTCSAGAGGVPTDPPATGCPTPSDSVAPAAAPTPAAGTSPTPTPTPGVSGRTDSSGRAGSTTTVAPSTGSLGPLGAGTSPAG